MGAGAAASQKPLEANGGTFANVLPVALTFCFPCTRRTLSRWGKHPESAEEEGACLWFSLLKMPVTRRVQVPSVDKLRTYLQQVEVAARSSGLLRVRVSRSVTLLLAPMALRPTRPPP